MSAARKSLLASTAGHVLLVGALIWLVGRAPPLQLPKAAPQNTVEVAFAAPPPPIPDVPDTPPPIPAALEPPPPLPEPPPVPVVAVEPPPPPPPPKPVVHRPPVRPPAERRVVERPEPPPEPRYAPPVQTAALPPMPAPAPPRLAPPSLTVSAGYRAELSGWLESHKQYPQSARERGEQGRVVVRFRVARSGRVLDYAVAGSSGYPDLDAAVDAMMRGAVLPPFPADITAPDIEISVTLRFALTR